MNSIPKCTSWRGHKFVARYSIGGARRLTSDELLWIPVLDRVDAMEATRTKTYERDICVRCGHVIERKT